MKIVFWGETRRCGTTSNMLAVAGMLAVLRPEATIEVRTLGVGQRLSVVEEKKKSILKGSAEEENKNILKGSDAEGKKNTSKGADDRKKKLCEEEKEAQFCFFDCGSGKNKWRRRVLRQADLVVVNLIQEEASLREFFLYDIHISSKVLILIGKYYELSRYGREYLEHYYRVDPEKFGVIPCNVQFELAAARGKIRHFVQKESRMQESERNKQFLWELTRFVELLLQNLEERQIEF